MERYDWQKPESKLMCTLARIALPDESCGYSDTIDRAVLDVENGLFTKLAGSLPSGITLLRFERGCFSRRTRRPSIWSKASSITTATR
ncbi:hypothetical protein [Mycolicibacterium elephantis]|uniref:hypothetical protein n=1 Tax=Mycolicibacterium elephantis TaxID=81858 RepID=UPI00104215AF|nr:hypothetical protein [Mycolicibacterium elephantis]